ncbi:MAG: RluA family pseudouridine synthase [Candidatus Omnitrophota bacterium]
MLHNIKIVFEDDWLLVVNKPAGLLTVPAPVKDSRTLTDILNKDVEERGLLYRVHPCHRLDRETSGLIVYAKGKVIQQKMMLEFKRKQVKKSYIAFAHGQFENARGEIKFSIDGQSAHTRYKILERRTGFVIMEVMPLTGRTNQIRIHFARIGHPLVGEDKYAFRRNFALRANRLCLHAEALEFRHPVTGKTVSVTVDLPEDMMRFLAKHE